MIVCLVPFQEIDKECNLKEYTFIHTSILKAYIVGTKEYIKYVVDSIKDKQLNNMYFMFNAQDVNMPIKSIKFDLRSLL